jgi:hypothetical protein
MKSFSLGGDTILTLVNRYEESLKELRRQVRFFMLLLVRSVQSVGRRHVLPCLCL